MTITRSEAKYEFRKFLKEQLKEPVYFGNLTEIVIPANKRGAYGVQSFEESPEEGGVLRGGSKSQDFVISCYGKDEEAADLLAEELLDTLKDAWPAKYLYCMPVVSTYFDEATRTYIVRIAITITYTN